MILKELLSAIDNKTVYNYFCEPCSPETNKEFCKLFQVEKANYYIRTVPVNKDFLSKSEILMNSEAIISDVRNNTLVIELY